MAGRPKNPNRPPTVTAVRITARTREKLEKAHKRWGTNEPLNNTIERALDELDQLRKKVEGLQVEIEDQRLENESKGQSYFNLFSLKENLRQRLENLEKQREQLVMRNSLK
jgi:predicted RNase H-like nuclease (RuvC/YqgF family)